MRTNETAATRVLINKCPSIITISSYYLVPARVAAVPIDLSDRAATHFILIRFEPGCLGNRRWIRTQGLGSNFSGQELTESIEKHGNEQPGAGGPALRSGWRSGASQAVK